MSISNIPPELQKLLLEGPALKAPPGVKANFVDPYSFYKPMFIGEVTLYVLTTFIVGIRVYTKLRILQKMAFNDYVLLVGWCLSVAILIVCGFAPENTLGVHQYNIQLKKLSSFIYLVSIDSVLYGIANVLIKTSILLQYITLFSPSRKSYFYWSCHGIIALNLLVYTTLTFIEIFTCKPIAKKWNVFLKGTCLNYQVNKVLSGVINVLSDFIIVGLPQGIIWKLNLTYRRRLGVSLIFAVGMLACIAAILRLYYSILLAHHEDLTWYTSLMAVFGIPELSFGTITSCLPSLAKAWKTLRRTTFVSQISSLLSRVSSLLSLNIPSFKILSRNKNSERSRSSSWSHPFQRQRESGEELDSVDVFVKGIEMDLRMGEERC